MLIVGGGTVIAAFVSEDRRQVRRYETWHLDGPSCATLSAGEALRRARKRFRLDDLMVARENGHLTCFEIKDHGGHGPGEVQACHLLTPGAVAVATPSRTFGFDPGVGRSAAVFVAGPSVTCVVGANARLLSPSSDRPYY